jgi:hypothetical protein
MVSELGGLPGKVKVSHHTADDLPGIRQRQPNTVNEVAVIDLAVLGALK